MSKELNLYTTLFGLSVTCELITIASTPVVTQSSIACIEVLPGIYQADMPNIAASTYLARFYSASNIIGQELITWSGSAEINPNPVTLSQIESSSVLTDKTGYSLTSTDKTAIADAVQSAILNEGDGQQIINAIVAAIGNYNIDQLALIAAIRADIERSNGMMASINVNQPTALQNATAVRTELAAELAHLDTSISTVADAVWNKVLP